MVDSEVEGVASEVEDVASEVEGVESEGRGASEVRSQSFVEAGKLHTPYVKGMNLLQWHPFT